MQERELRADLLGRVHHRRPREDEAARDAQSFGDRGRRNRVGGRDERAEHEADGPRQPRDGLMADSRDRERRREHEADRQQRERADVSAQIAERREERRRVEKRRQDRDEHDVRLQRDMRNAGHESERKTAENEQDRVGNSQKRREREQP